MVVLCLTFSKLVIGKSQAMSTSIRKKITSKLQVLVALFIVFTMVMAPLQQAEAAATNTSILGSLLTSITKAAAVATAPKISITAPKANAVVSGTTAITSTVTAGTGTVTSVQFKLDGTNLGTAVTKSPYSLSWNTAGVTNGIHLLTATATNSSKLSTTSAAISVNVQNVTTIPVVVPADTTAVANTPKISFTFDDGLASTYNNAYPTLAKYGLVGTVYAATGCIDMTTVPNTCRANTDTPYMSWSQVATLQNSGWEIASHTVTHPYLATSDATDGQPNVLTTAQVITELTQSKADLAAHGINATDFASPYGDYSMPVLAQIAKYYASQRGFADQNNNISPYNDYIINDYHVEGPTTVAQVEAKIDAAIASNQWLVMTFHNILPTASTNADDYEWSTANLDAIAAYVKAKQTAGLVKPVNINQGLVVSNANILPNASFNNGIADGWTTDSPTYITADSGTNGSYPDPTKSVKLTSAPSGNAHLFSPKVAVNPSTTYALKNFLNVQATSGGNVGFYIDEYDANGNWISGQYKKTEASVYVESLNFNYTPSSANVASASLQVIVAGAGVTAYLDNTQWFAISTGTPIVQTNLIANGTFDAGISNGWTTNDPVNITADAGNNGSPSNPVNSVKVVASATDRHLFSPKISVDSTKSYYLSTYVNIKTITSGEVGFYVDEYDANGNWISGQYKTSVHILGASSASFSYTPSSVNVKSASLQVIVVGNSGITAYVDDVRWYQN